MGSSHDKTHEEPPKQQRFDEQDAEQDDDNRRWLAEEAEKICDLMVGEVVAELQLGECKHWSEDAVLSDSLMPHAVNAWLKDNAETLISACWMTDDLREIRRAVREAFYRRYPNHLPKDRPQPKIAAPTPLLLVGFKYEYRYRHFFGTEALIALICAKKCQGMGLSDYSSDVVDWVVAELADQAPPDGMTAGEILEAGGAFVDLVVTTYWKRMNDTSGVKGQGTQLGNTRANYSGTPGEVKKSRK